MKITLNDFEKIFFCIGKNEILENDLKLKEIIKILKKQGYIYYVKANNTFLKENQIQIAFCKNASDLERVFNKFKKTDNFKYIKWNYLTYNNIYNVTYKKSYTLRNDK